MSEFLDINSISIVYNGDVLLQAPNTYKAFLESLRNKVRYYRQLDSYIQKDDEIQKNKDENSDSEEDDDIMDSIEEEKIEKKIQNIRKSNNSSQLSIKSRNSVSAEVYGIFNKKKTNK